ADRLFSFLVVLDDGVGHRREADGVVEVEDIGERHVALGGRIQLDHAINAEALLERHPDAWTQAVADNHVDLVVEVVRLARLLVQVTAQLADITEGGAVVLADVIPEAAGGELARQHQTAAATNDGGPAYHHAGGVVERQGAVHAILLRQAHGGVAERAIGFPPAAVVEDDGFRQTGGAGGVDIEQRVFQENPVDGVRVLGGAVLDQFGQVAIAGRRLARIFQGVLVSKIEEAAVFEVQFVAHFLDRLDQLGADDAGFRLHQVEAVGQDLAALGGVEQGGA